MTPYINYNSELFYDHMFLAIKKKRYAIIKNFDMDFFLFKSLYESFNDFFLSNDKLMFLGDLEYPYGYFGLIKKGFVTKHEDFYFFKGSPCPSYLVNILSNVLDIIKLLGIKIIKQLVEQYNNTHKKAIIYEPQSSKSLLRAIFYPYCNNIQSKVETVNPPHIDKSIITILPFSTSPGLQYFNKKWVNIDIKNQELLVICGNKLSQMSNGYFKPLLHRVNISNTICHRQSMAFFVS